MGKKLGSDYRLFVQSAVAGTFVQPAGQGNLTINRSKNFSTSATKDTEGVDTQTPGLRTLSINQAIVPSLPDPDGYTRMETLDKSNAAEVYQIRKKPFANGDVVFACLMYTALDNTGFEQGSTVTAGVQLQPAENPTVDTLS
ncbi:phage tail tube protein [Sphingomonas sp. GM_Shp_2]|uniref:phage tail tube protein n=1 Tax=Sphingomonas sp. GM_Shp_2 TaxID=2937380 RepID=UPI002269AF0D|nr:phage tail tube protein [Sphingomonas sp. GM_Shp_2]